MKQRGELGNSLPNINVGIDRVMRYSVMEKAMPKEDIVYMTAHHNDVAETGVSVGWMPASETAGGEVQVILLADPRHLEQRIELFESTVGPGAATKIASPALSRAELNKLIRALRNARDKAYGRDE